AGLARPPPRRHAGHGHSQPRSGRRRRLHRDAVRRPGRGERPTHHPPGGREALMLLLRWLLWRRWRSERARVLLTVLGVALGVSVFVAVQLASRSAMASFSDTVDAVSGRANLQVSAAADGFDERLYARIRREPGVQAAA